MPHSKTLTYLIGDIADTTVSSHMQKDHEEVLKILQELMSNDINTAEEVAELTIEELSEELGMKPLVYDPKTGRCQRAWRTETTPGWRRVELEEALSKQRLENPSTGGSLTGRVPWGADSTVRRRVIQAADSLTILLSLARIDTMIKSMEEEKKEIVRKLMRIEKKTARLETPYDPRSRKYPDTSDGS